MKKQSKRKNDLRSSIILLLILLLLLITSTYAWFTANETVTIDTIDVKIEAQNGLQISTNGTTWKSIIQNTDIKDNAYSGHNNILPSIIEPVSTVGEIDENGYMLMYHGSVKADEEDGGVYKLTASAINEKTPDINEDTNGWKYVAFDMFLKVDAETKLKLTTDSGVVPSGNTNTGIQYASRVAFCNEGTVSAGSTVSAITSQKGAVSFGAEGSTVYIWEPNSNWHTAAAVSHASDNYDNDDLVASGENDAVTYYGINQAFTTGVALNSTDTYFTQVTPTYITESDESGNLSAEENVFTLSAGITKMRVYMWVEGQDVDCENTASGTNISYNIQLQVVK